MGATNDTNGNPVTDREFRALQRENRRLVDTINRICKLVPGKARIWELDRIAAELDTTAADTEHFPEVHKALLADVLYIRRLEWDLGELRDVVRGNPRKKTYSRLDPANWPKGPRP